MLPFDCRCFQHVKWQRISTGFLNPTPGQVFVGFECWFREALSSIQRKDACPLLGFEGQFCAWGTFRNSHRNLSPPLKNAFLACMGGHPKHPGWGTLATTGTGWAPLVCLTCWLVRQPPAKNERHMHFTVHSHVRRPCKSWPRRTRGRDDSTRHCMGPHEPRGRGGVDMCRRRRRVRV